MECCYLSSPENTFNAILEFYSYHGWYPTQVELAALIGHSRFIVQQHIEILIECNWITRDGRKWRNLRITEAGFKVGKGE